MARRLLVSRLVGQREAAAALALLLRVSAQVDASVVFFVVLGAFLRHVGLQAACVGDSAGHVDVDAVDAGVAQPTQPVALSRAQIGGRIAGPLL